MPIALKCEQCGKALKVRDELAGKRVKCPQCQNVLRVPEATASAERWRLKTEEGDIYGPVDRAELDRWVSEGRITADCQVQQEEDAAWQSVTELYPQLATAAVESAPAAETPQSTSPPKLPATPQQSAPAQSAASSSSSALAEASPTAASTSKGKSGPVDFSALNAAEPQTAADSLDFAPTETGSTTPSGALDFSLGDTGRGGARSRGRVSPSKKSKSKISKGTSSTETGSEEVGPKSKIVTLLLAFFLGGLGVHRFYLGYHLMGALMLVTLGGCGVWALVDFVFILIGKVNRDAQGRLLKG